jgi:hypothetical protein
LDYRGTRRRAEQGFGLDRVACVQAFGEPGEDGRKQIARLPLFA